MNSTLSQNDTSPMRNQVYSNNISPQKTTVQVSSYSKPIQVQYPQNQYVQITPPRNTNYHIATPSTAQTHYSINGSAPSRFNQALDQVCLLGKNSLNHFYVFEFFEKVQVLLNLILKNVGHEMDIMRQNFEQVQVELQQWKDKCALIKVITSTPPPGTNYSPQRTQKLRNEIQSQFQNYQIEINKLNSIINNVNNELSVSSEKIKSLERRIGEMNKIELEMLTAKKQALELDNRNRFQALELNDLKSKIDTKNHQNDELIKQIMIIPSLKESLNILEEESKKLITMLDQKDDQLNRQDQRHMQMTKMYQDTLEKSNQIVGQLRELQAENDEIKNEVEKLNVIADSVNQKNNLYSSQSQSQRGRLSGEMSFNADDIKSSTGSKKSVTYPSSVKSQKNNFKQLELISTTIIDQQTIIDRLRIQASEKEQKFETLSKEKENLLEKIQEQINDVKQLKNDNKKQHEEHEEKIKEAKSEFNDQIQNTIIPLQKENEQMQIEIERLLDELQSNQLTLQQLQQQKDSLENQMNVERQQSLKSQQKIVKDNEMKCEALTERIIEKENELNGVLIKNQELYEDNKLMAEEIRDLKQKSIDNEYQKNKYIELKKETKVLRSQFDEYKQAFIREIQNRFSNNTDQFEQYLQLIDERLDSNRNATSSFNNQIYESSNTYQQYVQSPNKQRNIESLVRAQSPTQERLKAIKQTPSKSQSVSVKQLNNSNNNSSFTYTPIGQSNISPSIQERSQIQSNFNIVGNFNDKYNIMNNYAMKNQNEIHETNQELDNKLEELVILKAKYEQALNRVHSNINTSPNK